MGSIEMFRQVPSPFVRERADETFKRTRCRMGSSVLLELCWPATDKVAFDALERVERVAEVPLFVLLCDVCVSRRTFARQLALVLVVVVFEEVLVDVVHNMEFAIANRAHE